MGVLHPVNCLRSGQEKTEKKYADSGPPVNGFHELVKTSRKKFKRKTTDTTRTEWHNNNNKGNTTRVCGTKQHHRVADPPERSKTTTGPPDKKKKRRRDSTLAKGFCSRRDVTVAAVIQRPLLSLRQMDSERRVVFDEVSLLAIFLLLSSQRQKKQSSELLFRAHVSAVNSCVDNRRLAR